MAWFPDIDILGDIVKLHENGQVVTYQSTQVSQDENGNVNNPSYIKVDGIWYFTNVIIYNQ